MIEVLQRQHVQRRAVPPVRLRTRNTGVLWKAGQAAARREARREPSRWEQPRREPSRRERRGAGLSRFNREALARQQRRARPRASRGEGFRKGLAQSRAAIVGWARTLTRSPWLAAALLCVAVALLLYPTLASVGSPVRISLPVTAELDQDLYSLVVPEEPPPPAASSNPVLLKSLKVQSYKTRAGDTISQIAQNFKLNLDTLISYNDIRDARSLPVGTVLSIPNANGLKYRVRRGDSLERISKTYGLSLNSVLDWNRLASSVITVGQEIFLPDARMSQNELNKILGNLFIFPVQGRISSLFGNRHDPFTGVIRPHNGIDIVNKTGTPIQASMAGTVYQVRFNNNYGRYVIIQHSGYQTMYAHLDKVVVSEGTAVRQGQKIGELGNTGYSTGPHLHFSIFRNGEAVDPLRFLK